MSDSATDRYQAARQHMIDCQFRPNEVNDPVVIDAFSAIPRELFVPKAMRAVAYVDEDLKIGNDRSLMEPMIFAKLLVAAEISKDDLVLDIASATGYSSAVIAQMASSVVALESDAELVKKSEERLNELEIHNVAVIEGELSEGVVKQGPYNVIIISGAVDEVPAAITDQLAEGGRLVCVKNVGGVGRGYLATKKDGVVSGRDLFDANVPVLSGFVAEKGFVF